MVYRIERVIDGRWVLGDEEFTSRSEAVALMRRLLESRQASRGQIQVVNLLVTDKYLI